MTTTIKNIMSKIETEKPDIYKSILASAALKPEKLGVLTPEQEAVKAYFKEAYVPYGHDTLTGDEDYNYSFEQYCNIMTDIDRTAPKYGYFLVESQLGINRLCSLIYDRRTAGIVDDHFPTELLPKGFDPEEYAKGNIPDGSFDRIIKTEDILAFIKREYNDKGNTLSHDSSNIVHGGVHDAGWIAHYQYLRYVGGIETARNIDFMCEFSKDIGWWAPFEDFLLMQMKPTICKVEEEERRPMAGYRMHSFDGPSIKWRDGTYLNYIYGVKIDDDAIVNLDKDSTELANMYFTEQNAEVRLAIGSKVGLDRLAEKMPQTVLDTTTLDKFPIVLADFQRREEGKPFVFTNADGVDVTVDAGVKEELPPWSLTSSGSLDTNAVAYTLLDIEMADGTQERYLKMGNASEDKIHIECVTQECNSVLDALAFRWGITTEEFSEVVGYENGVYTKFSALA